MERISLFLSGKQIERLKELAVKSGISFSEHQRRAIDEYLERKEEKKKE